MRRALVLVMLLLAACQPMPAPYAPTAEEKSNPLLVLRDATGVWIEQPVGLPTEVGLRLAESVAENLKTADIPAAVGTGNRGSAVLRAAGQIYPVGPAEAQLAITWQFIPPDSPLVEWQQREAIPRGAGLPPMPGQLERMARTTAQKLIPLLASLTPMAALAEGVAIGSIEGAPGDGALALKRALDYSLKQRGVRVADQPGPTALLVRARVQMGTAVNNVQAIRLTWGLFTPDGAEIGTVQQENDIPAGSLDKSWGQVAVYAAEGAVDGLKPLIDRAPALKPAGQGK